MQLKSPRQYLLIVLMILAGSDAWADQPPIKIDGTDHMNQISNSWVLAAQSYNFSLSIQHAQSGSGGGFKKFSADAIDINQSSRPIKPQEHLECQASGISYLDLVVAHSKDGTESLILFVKTSSLERESVRDYLKYCLSDSGQALAERHGKRLTRAELETARRRYQDTVNTLID